MMLKHSIWNTEAYGFYLPKDQIAKRPVKDRDQARLLVLHKKTGFIEHKRFFDLIHYLHEGDVVVVNHSKVFRARLLGYRVRREKNQWIRGGKVECLLVRKTGKHIWESLFHAAAAHQKGLCFEIIGRDQKMIRGEIIEGKSHAGTVVVRFEKDPVAHTIGEIPLPPYLREDLLKGQNRWAEPEKREWKGEEEAYQTVYAKHIGSCAAPTAGLHFTLAFINKLKQKGVHWEEVSLHVGPGTFRPVKVKDIRTHSMHAESFFFPKRVAQTVLKAKEKGKKIFAIGTTSVRVLETVAQRGVLSEQKGETSLFIYPGFSFQVVDAMVTNFHLPKSTLLMLVSAFSGKKNIEKSYQEAIEKKYRFYSFGDAMLIL